MKVELTKFRVKPNKSDKVEEWMAYIEENMDDALLTLEGEKMYVETIFREQNGEHEYLYWYSVQEDDPEDEEDFNINQKLVDFFDECIDKTFQPLDLDASVVMMPKRIRNAMFTGGQADTHEESID
ncbi:DUF6176 family protein [Salinicoccus bachuensis]|uniref:DUF6176 family protein n=1 Tax=Salinicoccus bachuensis TaxID=3136731 RepID=A0ABZ3CFV1_9STAP